jgi:cysteinyl-tRNA synthetase
MGLFKVKRTLMASAIPRRIRGVKLSLTNTLSGKKEIFVPLKEIVNVYCCGPTVYGFTHVGNARAALTADLVVRSLEYFGYKVRFARNFTDVDDKIIARSKEEGLPPEEIARKYADAYSDELKMLKTRPADSEPRVTESMEAIIQFIADLIEQDAAYILPTSQGNDVYFRTRSFEHYGCLSHRKLDDMISGTRAETQEGKEDEADFALWKASKPGEIFWESPWGAGRPGWHIECSAMIDQLFGQTLDIHMGGIDLVFPHHENEIAQSEKRRPYPLARYWLHNGLLELGQEKMSKSLGNIVRTKDFLERHPADVLRLLFLQQHYRSPLDFSPETIHRAEALLERLAGAWAHALAIVSKPQHKPQKEKSALLVSMEQALADDFNSAKALGLLLAETRKAYKIQSVELWTEWLSCLPLLQAAFGLFNGSTPEEVLQEIRSKKLKRHHLSTEKAEWIETKLLERQKAREKKDFAESDRIRDELAAQSVLVMDGPDGSSWDLKENH